MLVAVAYHYIRPRFDHPYPGIHGITPAQFEAQLKELARLGEFVSAGQLRDAVRGTANLPAAALFVTFDDGLMEQFEHALPVLDRLGIPAVFFVNTAPIADQSVLAVHKIHLLRASMAPPDFVALLKAQAQHRGIRLPSMPSAADSTAVYPYDSPEAAGLKYLLNFQLQDAQRNDLVAACFTERFGAAESSISATLYMGRSHVRALADRGYLGTHGHAHVPLGLIPSDAMRADLAISLDLLTRWGGSRPFALGYPYGTEASCTSEVGAGAFALGVELGFTMERAGNQDLRAPLYLGRYDCNDLPGGKRPRFTRAHRLGDVAHAGWGR